MVSLAGDGLKDVVTCSESTGAVFWARQTSPRVFAAASQFGSMPSEARFLTNGLIDGDTRQDLVIVGSMTVAVWTFTGSNPSTCSKFTVESSMYQAQCAQIGDVGT